MATIITKRNRVTIIKESVDEDERFVMGLVFSPEEVDTQGDITSAMEIRKTAHGFMLQDGTINVMHKGRDVEVAVVESFIAPVNFTLKNREGEVRRIKKGSWLMGIIVGEEEADLWHAIKKGHFKGFSMEGQAEAESLVA